jgi:hypothetical protein
MRVTPLAAGDLSELSGYGLGLGHEHAAAVLGRGQ